MGERIVKCECGQRMRVPESALGKRGKCAACGQGLFVDLDNSWPLEADLGAPSPFDAEEEEDSLQVGLPPEERCSRCGRTIQGDWDRHEMAQGVNCHICANQAAEHVPQAKRAAHPAPLEPRVPSSAHQPHEEHSGRPVRAFLASKKGQALVFAGISATLMAAVLLLPVEEYAARLFAAGESLETGEVDTKWWGVILAVRYALQFLRVFTALYLCLAVVNALPNETWGKNLIAVGAVAILLFLSSFMAINFFIGFIITVGQVIFIWHLYQLGFGGVCLYLILGPLLGPVFWALDALAMGVISAIAM